MTLRNARSPKEATLPRRARKGFAPRKAQSPRQPVLRANSSQRAETPVYAVEFKVPHKVATPTLVAGLHEMVLARDVINREGDTFAYHITRLVVAVVTQIFSYMVDSGVQDGYICTGEDYAFSIFQKVLLSFNTTYMCQIKTCKRTISAVSTGMLSTRCITCSNSSGARCQGYSFRFSLWPRM